MVEKVAALHAATIPNVEYRCARRGASRPPSSDVGAVVLIERVFDVDRVRVVTFHEKEWDVRWGRGKTRRPNALWDVS